MLGLCLGQCGRQCCADSALRIPCVDLWCPAGEHSLEDEASDDHKVAAYAHKGQLAHSSFPLHNLYKAKHVPALCLLRAHMLWLNVKRSIQGWNVQQRDIHGTDRSSVLRGRCQLRESCWQQCARCESIGPHRSNFGPEYLPATHGAGKGLDGGEHLSEEEDEEQEDEDEDVDENEEEEDVDGKEEASGTDAGAEESRVCIVTADYAMQNVALQMGLRLVAPDGKRIWQTRRWALRCTACFQVCKVHTCLSLFLLGHHWASDLCCLTQAQLDIVEVAAVHNRQPGAMLTPVQEAGRLFCSKCGNAALQKVEVLVGSDGAQQYGVRKKHIIRGTRFPLPKPHVSTKLPAMRKSRIYMHAIRRPVGPLSLYAQHSTWEFVHVFRRPFEASCACWLSWGERLSFWKGVLCLQGGKNSKDPILREDVLLQRIPQLRYQAKKEGTDPFAPEFGIETWHQRHDDLPPHVKAAAASLSMWKVKNPNERKHVRTNRRRK